MELERRVMAAVKASLARWVGSSAASAADAHVLVEAGAEEGVAQRKKSRASKSSTRADVGPHTTRGEREERERERRRRRRKASSSSPPPRFPERSSPPQPLPGTLPGALLAAAAALLPHLQGLAALLPGARPAPLRPPSPPLRPRQRHLLPARAARRPSAPVTRER
jgi:hypothetical protein